MKIIATLRKKTERRLDQASCQILKNVLADISMLTFEEMDNLIWSLTYDAENACTKLGFANMPPEQIVTIRAEIANFYRMYNSGWQYGHLYTPATEQEKALLRALFGDHYAYDRVMSQLNFRLSCTQFEYDKLIRCLCSTQQPSQFGGLRYLGFSLEESRFLQNCANQAGAVFEALRMAS